MRIHDVKRGPFFEHSSQLYSIATGVPSWTKVNSGLFKMYRVRDLRQTFSKLFNFGSGRSSGQTCCGSAYPFGRTIRMGVLIFRGQGLWELYDSICDQRNERWAHGLLSPLDFLWLSDVAYSTEYSHQSTNSPEFTIVYAIHPYYGRLCPQSCHEF